MTKPWTEENIDVTKDIEGLLNQKQYSNQRTNLDMELVYVYQTLGGLLKLHNNEKYVTNHIEYCRTILWRRIMK